MPGVAAAQGVKVAVRDADHTDVSIAVPSPEARPRSLAAALTRVRASELVAAIVAISALLRIVASWSRETPVYLPDEYLYSELGRSLVESGEALVRGSEVSFPSLLQPVVTAPFWLIDDVDTAYRLIQAFGAVAMSLAAVPAFLLARRVGLGSWASLGVAAAAVAVPDLLLASWIVAEPLAYPLLLGAIWAGVSAIAEPRRWAQLAFVGLSGLAVLGRIQLACVPVAFVVALVVVGARERRLGETLRWHALPIAVLAIPLVGALALLLTGRLGPYSGAVSVGVDAAGTLQWSATNALVLAYAAGWAIVPGALVGFALAVGRPRSRAEAAFGALGGTFALATLLQAGLVSSSLSDHVHERYVFPLVPLLAIAFCLWVARDRPGRLPYAVLAALLLAVSAAVPLSGLAAGQGKADSAVLRAFGQLEASVGSSGTAALIVAAAAGIATVVACVAPLSGRVAHATLGVALGACAIASAGAVAFDATNSGRVRADLPADASWVDGAVARTATLVWTPGGAPADALELLFWNRSVTDAVRLPGALPFDPYGADGVVIESDGTLSRRGRVVGGPLVVDERGTTLLLADATEVARSTRAVLWVPATDGPARASVLLVGRSWDGLLAPSGELTVWPVDGAPVLAARLELDVEAPTAPEPATLELVPDVGAPLRATVQPGTAGRITAMLCSRGPWHARFTASPRLLLGDRVATLRMGVPRLVPDPAACAGRVPTEAPPAPGLQPFAT